MVAAFALDYAVDVPCPAADVVAAVRHAAACQGYALRHAAAAAVDVAAHFAPHPRSQGETPETHPQSGVHQEPAAASLAPRSPVKPEVQAELAVPAVIFPPFHVLQPPVLSDHLQHLVAAEASRKQHLYPGQIAYLTEAASLLAAS